MFLMLLACVTPQPTAELDDAEQRWAEAGITDYTYTLTWQCFCPEGGTPSAVEVQGGEVVGSTPELPEASTVEGLFDTVRSAIESDPDAFDVSYDAVLGYPTMLDVDPMANAMDEEYGFEAKDLTESSP